MAKPALPTRPLDEAARDGRYKFVANGQHFAVARWHMGAFEFPSGALIGFEPTGYYEPGAADG